MQRLMFGCIAILALALPLHFYATSVQANPIPDPWTTTFDDQLGRSPRNEAVAPAHQYTFSGILRDSFGNPMPGYPASMVELKIIAPCQNPVTFLPDGASNSHGELFWGPQTLTQGGGSCAAAATVRIEVYSMLFKTLDAVTSPDQDGDGLVALSDLQTWQVAFVSQGPTYQGDLDFDGLIALSDLQRWQNHFVAP